PEKTGRCPGAEMQQAQNGVFAVRVSMMEMSPSSRLSRSKAFCRGCAIAFPVWLGSNSAASAQGVAGTAELPRDLSPWGMYVTADWVVKAVLIGLLMASVITWTVWLAK